MRSRRWTTPRRRCSTSSRLTDRTALPHTVRFRRQIHLCARRTSATRRARARGKPPLVLVRSIIDRPSTSAPTDRRPNRRQVARHLTGYTIVNPRRCRFRASSSNAVGGRASRNPRAAPSERVPFRDPSLLARRRRRDVARDTRRRGIHLTDAPTSPTTVDARSRRRGLFEGRHHRRRAHHRARRPSPQDAPSGAA